MRLTVLGCAGTFPGPRSGCSSYLLEHDGFRLMVDCGNGAVGALQRHADLLDVQAIAVSHLHADHCIDLVAYAYARRYHPRPPAGLLPVYGPAGTRERICAAADGRGGGWLDEVYDWRPLGEAALQVGPFALTPRRTAHPIECYALRVQAGGRTLAYSADAGPCPALAEVARDADVFLCEASFLSTGDNPDGVHLTGAQAGQVATEAAARSLLLTHLVAWHDEGEVLAEAQREFAGPLALARDGVSYPV